MSKRESIKLDYRDGSAYLTGRTYLVRSELKKLGAEFLDNDQGWRLDPALVTEAAKAIKQADMDLIGGLQQPDAQPAAVAATGAATDLLDLLTAWIEEGRGLADISKALAAFTNAMEAMECYYTIQTRLLHQATSELSQQQREVPTANGTGHSQANVSTLTHRGGRP